MRSQKEVEDELERLQVRMQRASWLHILGIDVAVDTLRWVLSVHGRSLDAWAREIEGVGHAEETLHNPMVRPVA